jgi:two-component system, chemotaxis family, CheB/CheR fusion protein
MARRRRIKSARDTRRPLGNVAVEPESTAREEWSPSTRFPIVGVGASAGGLDPITQLLHSVRSDTGMAFIIVLHLDPTHASRLTDIIARATTMPVAEVTDEPRVEANHVYVIPPGKNMIISKGVLKLLPREPRGIQRPVDVFLKALADDQRHLAIGVILSGMGTDGTAGLDAIKAEGGITFAQNESAQYEGMPRSAIDSGSVDFILPPEGIAREIARIVRHPFVAPAVPRAHARDADIEGILTALRYKFGVDFSEYRGSTLNRRIGRRMVLHKVETLKDYVGFLESNPGEVEALFQDILISVTAFFRNPEAFEYLRTHVFPRLAKKHSRFQPVRMWVLGCSTGEEAYSLAIEWRDFADESGLNLPIQIYATDLNEASIDKARAGFYGGAIAQDVSPDRLRRFFVESPGGYRIIKSIRDMCVFACHNALNDPPFSRMDLVSCRNVLIYLEPELQQRVVPILHYALQPEGFLFLGASETVGAYRDLLEVEDARHKIFVKKKQASWRAGPLIPTGQVPASALEPGAIPKVLRERGETMLDPIREADRAVLVQYSPPGVLVSEDWEIIQFRGDTGAFLAPGPGRPSANLLKMAREGLLVPLRTVLTRAKREDAPVREENVHVKSNGGFRVVHVQVIPIRPRPGRDRTFLVVFEDAEPKLPRLAAEKETTGVGDVSQAEQEEKDRLITRLTEELTATREYLQSVIEQQEVANEELQSANEEVQSVNEELQSSNEELETSKEEIESSNEELSTVNDELQNRISELNRANDDMSNLLAGVQTAVVIVSRDLRIRRFTPMAERLLNVVPGDLDRPIGEIKLNLEVPDLEALLVEAIETVRSSEREVRDRHGHWYSLRLRPYKSVENRIEGAVLMLVDIDSLKQNQETLRRQTELLEQVQEPMVIWTIDGKITYWNRGAERTYGHRKEQAVGRDRQKLLPTTSDPSEFMESLARTGQWTGELTRAHGDGRRIVVESRMMLVQERNGRRVVVETNHPITERKELEEALSQRAGELLEADRRKNEFLAMLAHELRNPLASIANTAQALRSPVKDPAMAVGAIELLERQIRIMTRMTDDLIDVSQVTQGRVRLTLEPADLVSIVTRATSLSGHQFAARGQKFSITLPKAPVFVLADTMRLEQVVVNLLDNATKYTPSGGNIVVSVSRDGNAPESGQARGKAVVRVEDDGEGIAPEMLGRVFDLFSQADQSLARVHGGLGIGLTLVRKLVELHGGTVEAESTGVGRGSVFTVRLPLAATTAAASPKARPVVEQPTRPRRILVVDDFADAADSLAVVLRSSGHEVRVAYAGEDALKAVEDMKPEVVLLDVGLPDMDGYEVARQIRSRPDSESILLVAITGYGQEEARQASKRVGFDRHLTKPVDPAALQIVLATRRDP